MLFSSPSSPLYAPFAFIPPNPRASRSPCPALNALANHGYIPRSGTRIPFWTLLSAVQHVYNLSFPLALLLTTFGYLTSGTLSFPTPHAPHKEEQVNPSLMTAITDFLPWPTWTLNLTSLCAQGPFKIAHDASLVHPDYTASTAPNPVLLAQFLSLAHHEPSNPISSPLYPGSSLSPLQLPTMNFIITTTVAAAEDGLTLADLGRLHAARAAALPPAHALNRLHEQVALGECGLAWCVMRSHHKGEDAERGVIPLAALEQWFGEERLPEGWWDVGGGRPVKPVGLREAGARAKEVGLFMVGS
ncbi:hypothetical protein D9615_007652 [Tricholomella constricta]|uniref:Heme haloperoxidase family profile domain-containing protein n=1 Tax=Tricholomella constricta TaxID=117010 RepID=A0A8H5M0B4_9AGAR|nr:hypothetical protein D9615_007652 [Tricholomella constricta]